VRRCWPSRSTKISGWQARAREPGGDCKVTDRVTQAPATALSCKTQRLPRRGHPHGCLSHVAIRLAQACPFMSLGGAEPRRNPGHGDARTARHSVERGLRRCASRSDMGGLANIPSPHSSSAPGGQVQTGARVAGHAAPVPGLAGQRESQNAEARQGKYPTRTDRTPQRAVVAEPA
jgi:hypothetical protein